MINRNRIVRESTEYRAVEAFYRTIGQPGTGQISDASDLDVSADGQRALFAGTIVDTLDRTPSTHICLTYLSSGDTRVLTFGTHNDRLPKFAPDGRRIAFLSDCNRSGDFQLY